MRGLLFIGGLFLNGLKFQGNGIYAIPQAGWFGAVWEYMAQMSSTPTADHLRSNHTMAVIWNFSNGLIAGRGIETRPTAMGIKFRF